MLLSSESIYVELYKRGESWKEKLYFEENKGENGRKRGENKKKKEPLMCCAVCVPELI